MEIPRSLLDELTREVNALSGAAQAQAEMAIGNVLAEWDGKDVAALRTAAFDAIDALLSTYADLSAARAAEFYDAVRGAQGAARKYRAVADSRRNPAATEGAVRAMVQSVVETGDTERFERDLIGRVDTEVRRAANECVAYNGGRDPAKPRYARVPKGDTCKFCLMLASRGFVYKTAEAAKHAHPHCDCRVVPGFADEVQVEGYDPDELADRWHKFEEIDSMKDDDGNPLAEFARSTLKVAYTAADIDYDKVLRALEACTVPAAKLEKYSLSPENDPNKARAFRGYLGYTKADAATVAAKVYEYVADHAPKYKDTTQHGDRFTTEMVMGGKDGKSAKVRVGWIRDGGTGKMRLTTIFVDE